MLVKKAGLIKGKIMDVNTLEELAPKSCAASSIAGSICRNEAAPVSSPTGNYLITKFITIIAAVPTMSRGGLLKASM